MPKTPIDYSTTIIYKLVKNDDYDNANVYVGSTTDFVKRKYSHKNCCNNEKQKDHNEKKYQYIRENGGWDCFYMIEVEKFPCNDKREAEAREEYWRCHFNAQLNTRKAYTTYEERLEQNKKHDEKRKEERKEYHKKLITCKCGCIITQGCLIRHKKTQKHIKLLDPLNIN